MGGDNSDIMVFLVVVALRFIIPLFIPRFPLPAILAALVLDAADQTIFQKYQQRWILFIFPNTFEYFFIAIVAVRTMWDPRRLSRGAVIGTAAFIWIFVKLPQPADRCHHRRQPILRPTWSGWKSLGVQFAVLAAINAIVLSLYAQLFGDGLDRGLSLFFGLLLTMIIVLYDRFIGERTGRIEPVRITDPERTPA